MLTTSAIVLALAAVVWAAVAVTVAVCLYRLERDE